MWQWAWWIADKFMCTFKSALKTSCSPWQWIKLHCRCQSRWDTSIERWQLHCCSITEFQSPIELIFMTSYIFARYWLDPDLPFIDSNSCCFRPITAVFQSSFIESLLGSVSCTVCPHSELLVWLVWFISYGLNLSHGWNHFFLPWTCVVLAIACILL